MSAAEQGAVTGRRPPGRRLAFRIGAALTLGSAAILLLAVEWNLRLQRTQLTGVVSGSADRVADIIRRSTRDGMLRNDREGVMRTIQNIATQPGIARIRVFNKEGRISTSTDPAEVGHLVDVRAEQCYACHQQDRPLEQLERSDRVRIFESPGNGRVLAVIAPIHNEPQCATACHAHPATQRVLGVLDVHLSLASVEEALSVSERQMLLGLAATVAAMLLLGAGLLWRMVLRPVHRLTDAMARVTAGDLETRLPVRSGDEIGDLAASWNAMTGELARARAQLEGWNRMLEQRVRDKTDELERAHQRMLLIEKMASLGKLAAVVAHEINNPLAGIRTYARLLRRRAAEKPATNGEAAEAARILHVIDSEAGRCGDIVRNLLLFSRSSAARFAAEDVAALAERCRMLLNHQAEMLGVELAVEVQPGLAQVECDAGQVEQMLLALSMNGLEATPAGGRVTIAARADGDAGLWLSVADTGAGIPPEIQQHVFEPFFTTKEQGKGVGLGLAVVYGIVERHHGRIELTSRPGEGTRFTVHLPWRQPAPATAEAQP